MYISGTPLHYQADDGATEQLSSAGTVMADQLILGENYEDVWEPTWKLMQFHRTN